MSSKPGNSLEDFLAWMFDVVVEGRDDANASLQIAEALGTTSRSRQRLTYEQFSKIVNLYESSRDYVERRLADFDEETQSWRGYAGCSFDDLPEILSQEAFRLIDGFRIEAAVKKADETGDSTPVVEEIEGQIDKFIKNLELSMRRSTELTVEAVPESLSPADAARGWSWTVALKQR